MFIDVYVKKQNKSYYSRKGTISLNADSYTDATAFLEFNKKAKFVPKQDYKAFGLNKTDFTNLWFNVIEEKLYTIKI